MVFCGSCGSVCPDGMRFCTTCGTPLGGNAPGGGGGAPGGGGGASRTPSSASPTPARGASQQQGMPQGGGNQPRPGMAKNRAAPNMPNQPGGGGDWVQGEWTEESAFNTPMALSESQRWIEAVTGEKFKSDDFVQSTRDGILLCKLMNGIMPGSIPRVNYQNTAFAQRENIAQFIAGCKKLGLKETQCFVTNDLFEGQNTRTVAVTLYWLGRAARSRPEYRGPQMRMSMFCKMKCSRCQKPILDENYIVTMDQQWHTACANCDNCGNALGPDGYHQDGNRVLCPQCADTGVGKCATCQKKLHEGDLYHGPDASGKMYCEDCHCHNCKDPVKSNNSIKCPTGTFCAKCSCLHCKRPF